MAVTERPPSYSSSAPQSNASPSTGESAPIYQDSEGFFTTRNGRLLLLLIVIVIGAMFLLAFGFCIDRAVVLNQPRYYALIINIVLSTIVTGLLLFWLFRGVMATSLVWYVFVQCTFLFFQLVTTDVFAWYESSTITPTTPPPIHPSVHPTPTPSCIPNATHNCTNSSRPHNPWRYQHPVEW